MSFQQGLSGLNAASKSLEAIGNNVANANTVGYKAGQAQFADVYANALGGSGASQVGLGTKTAGISQQFTQGNITSTSNPLDIAINGNGFFRLSNNGTITYSRNGQFELDKEGYIITPTGSRLTGNIANAQGLLSSGAPVELKIDTSILAPRITTQVDTVLNLDSRLDPPVTSPFDASDPTSYNNATSVTVYDVQGVAHVVQTYYVKTTSGWDVYASNDDAAIGAIDAAPATTAVASQPLTGTPTSFTDIAAGTFSINGVSIGFVDGDGTAATQLANLVTAINSANAGVTASVVAGALSLSSNTTPASPITISMNGVASDSTTATANRQLLANQIGLNINGIGTQAVTATKVGNLTFSNGGTLLNTNPVTIPLTVDINGVPNTFTVGVDYSGTTQYGSTFGVSKLEQDGYASGRLSGFSAGGDGTIIGRYSNGESRTLGRIILASFANPNGLQPAGDNAWAETVASGEGYPNIPGSGSVGMLQSSAVEDSNIDLTAELVNMITAQRVYQANAQTIKTQDQVMQTLVNLR